MKKISLMLMLFAAHFTQIKPKIYTVDGIHNLKNMTITLKDQLQIKGYNSKLYYKRGWNDTRYEKITYINRTEELLEYFNWHNQPLDQKDSWDGTIHQPSLLTLTPKKP